MSIFWCALCMCVSMFTILPAPRVSWREELQPLRTACLPLAGLLIGGLWLGVAYLAGWLLPRALAAAVICLFPLVISGFMHIDGFMDTADALMSWKSREDRMHILKDVHVGSFAVVLLAAAMLLSFASCMSIDKPFALLLIPVISRTGSAYCVLTLQPLEHSQYAAPRDKASATLGKLLLAFGGLALLAMLLFGGWRALIVGVATAAGYALAMGMSVRTFGGVSGDLAGFSLVIAEMCGLVALAIV